MLIRMRFAAIEAGHIKFYNKFDHSLVAICIMAPGSFGWKCKAASSRNRGSHVSLMNEIHRWQSPRVLNIKQVLYSPMYETKKTQTSNKPNGYPSMM